MTDEAPRAVIRIRIAGGAVSIEFDGATDDDARRAREAFDAEPSLLSNVQPTNQGEPS